MPRKTCAHKGRIADRLRTGLMYCHRVCRKVTVVVEASGSNYCMDGGCIHSPAFKAKATAEQLQVH